MVLVHDVLIAVTRSPPTYKRPINTYSYPMNNQVTYKQPMYNLLKNVSMSYR